MMHFKSLQAVALLALLGSSLCSCSSGRIEAQNPTISQMDALDVQWGLPQRTSRGGAVRRYEGGSQSYSPAPARTAPASEPVQQPAAAPAAPAPSTVDPNVIKSLR